jgi:hypothetical protein
MFTGPEYYLSLPILIHSTNHVDLRILLPYSNITVIFVFPRWWNRVGIRLALMYSVPQGCVNNKFLAK